MCRGWFQKGRPDSRLCPAEDLSLPWFSDSVLPSLLPLGRQGAGVPSAMGRLGQVMDERSTKPNPNLARGEWQQYQAKWRAEGPCNLRLE